MTMLRAEYPRPSFVRKEWLSLNGEWDFALDDDHLGKLNNQVNHSDFFTRKITVPFPYQSKLSGIGDRSSHSTIWYQRNFEVPKHWSGKRMMINFGAVDFETTVWLNGDYIGFNRGGFVPFTFDITDYLREGENRLVLKVDDDEHPNHPRGKQSAKKESWECWYTRISGIWQSVWLEPVSAIHLQNIKLQPDIDQEEIVIQYELSTYHENITLNFKVSFHEKIVAEKSVAFEKRFSRFSDLPLNRQTSAIVLTNPQLWSPEEPNLYDLEVEVICNQQVCDQVHTYFGMRKVSTEKNRIYLNNKPYYLRMVLDQGIWPEGIYTPETVTELIKDIEMTKAFGFNSARKHQKIEDPYYYYYCDKLGLLVWSEMPSCYHFDRNMVSSSIDEWQRVIARDFNHPCIMAWLPVNESWGLEPLHHSGTGDYQKAVHYLETLYHLTKTLDDTRLVISNDGWEHATTDLITIHDYTQDEQLMAENYHQFKTDRYASSFNHQFSTILPEYSYQGQPILITEFGGVKVNEQGINGWGYGEAEGTYSGMLARIKKLVRTILKESEVCGYCYTQLTDTEQEINGLMDSNRVPKLATNKLAEIFSQQLGGADFDETNHEIQCQLNEVKG